MNLMNLMMIAWRERYEKCDRPRRTEFVKIGNKRERYVLFMPFLRVVFLTKLDSFHAQSMSDSDIISTTHKFADISC